MSNLLWHGSNWTSVSSWAFHPSFFTIIYILSYLHFHLQLKALDPVMVTVSGGDMRVTRPACGQDVEKPQRDRNPVASQRPHFKALALPTQCQQPQRLSLGTRTSPCPSTIQSWRWPQLHSEDRRFSKASLKHRAWLGCCSLAYQTSLTLH